VHYRAPTEGGSSGSPVFNDQWEVIALHHKGGKVGMPRLNGLNGTYAANEGISIRRVACK
jgi:V8-like Glu-specific endopeptidase